MQMAGGHQLEERGCAMESLNDNASAFVRGIFRPRLLRSLWTVTAAAAAQFTIDPVTAT
jgi:hypothetical protein